MIEKYIVECTYWDSRNLKRTLTSDADDITQLYLSIGILLGKLFDEPYYKCEEKCICIKLKSVVK